MSMLIVFLAVFSIPDQANSFGIGSTLYCYQCVSSQPGCSPFNWLWQWSQACPEIGDTCVKLIETIGAKEVITRDCLSALKGVRTDLPADHYEGCKRAALDVKLGNYVNSSVKELDIKKNHYESTTFCYCSFDNRCNDGSLVRVEKPMFALFVAFFVARLCLS